MFKNKYPYMNKGSKQVYRNGFVRNMQIKLKPRNIFEIIQQNREANPKCDHLHSLLFAKYNITTFVLEDIGVAKPDINFDIIEDFKNVIDDENIQNGENLQAEYLNIAKTHNKLKYFKAFENIDTRINNFSSLTPGEIDMLYYAISYNSLRLECELTKDINKY
jgi:hypothetical protein